MLGDLVKDFPRRGVTTGFLTQSINTRDGCSQVGDEIPNLSKPLMSPLVRVSATLSPKPEHLLVFVMDTIDIVPLAMSSMSFKTVQL